VKDSVKVLPMPALAVSIPQASTSFSITLCPTHPWLLVKQSAGGHSSTWRCMAAPSCASAALTPGSQGCLVRGV
jgi:hypothetical protein